ncbi:MAG: hypothetical protein D5R98_09690 [Desulfonatronovibrio sp. MSAO_Bac4]|nr:MAG: hypothetical protein D5R98_09690 [Desulfonatronovibrio sp. MSAO_Bac4]
MFVGDHDFAKRKVCIILHAESEKQVEKLSSLVPDKDCRHFRNGPTNWTTQLYIELKDRGYPVVASYKPMRGCLNIGHVSSLRVKDFGPEHFLVEILADRRPSGLAQAYVVQNKLLVSGHSHFWMPLWPQPGLVKRDPQRGTKIKTCAFAGRPGNLLGGSRLWVDALRKKGVAFQLLEPQERGDLRHIDCLIGLRERKKKSSLFSNKPPSKLINAWLADIPFIGGNDSAYAQVGEPGIDYLVAETILEAMTHIDSLCRHPELYTSLVKHGRIKGAHYTREATVARWVDLLWSVLWPKYDEWRSRPYWSKALRRYTYLGFRGMLRFRHARIKN